MQTHIVKIQTSKEYDVVIGNVILSECGKQIFDVIGKCRAAVITDSNVGKHYLSIVMSSLENAGIDTKSFSFPAGEEQKNISTLSDILEFLAREKFSRTDVVVALGGGVTGDMAGFAAAVYLRGVRYVQIPTSLLAAVDSSVGGKTAIDLNEGKNLAGAFLQPETVICDTDTLKTLPKEELLNGLCEAIKYGVLFDEELFSDFENLAQTDIASLVERCVSHKGRIVANDEFENGERKLLNLGHTIGHAIEKCSDYKIKHGYAVAIGLCMIARAGEKLLITEKGTAKRIESLFKKHSIPTNTDFSTEELLSVALADKKRQNENITLVVPKKIGECILKTEPISKLEDYIRLGKEEL